MTTLATLPLAMTPVAVPRFGVQICLIGAAGSVVFVTVQATPLRTGLGKLNVSVTPAAFADTVRFVPFIVRTTESLGARPVTLPPTVNPLVVHVIATFSTGTAATVPVPFATTHVWLI